MRKFDLSKVSEDFARENGDLPRYKIAFDIARQEQEEGVNVDPYFVLGLVYDRQHTGSDAAPDDEKALAYFEKSMEYGCVKALHELASNYINGGIVPKNSALGYELMLRAALLGDYEAMYNMGNCNLYSIGCVGIANRALKWYRKGLAIHYNEKVADNVEMLESLPEMDTSFLSYYDPQYVPDELTDEDKEILTRYEKIFNLDFSAALAKLETED